MLPQIKTRLKTEELYRDVNKSPSSMKKKQPKRNSSIIACLPYIRELKQSYQKYTPQCLKKKQKKSERTENITQKNVRSLQEINYVPSENLNYETVPVHASQTKSLKKAYLNNDQQHISSLIRHFQKIKRKDLGGSSLQLKNSRSLNKFSGCEQQYERLPPRKHEWNYEVVQNFMNVLSPLNPFFNKLNKMVTLCLLKIGNIKKYEQEEIIQKENCQAKKVGIVLWGQVLLKNEQSKMKIYLFPGDSLNEEIIFSTSADNSTEIHYQKKGSTLLKQKAKAKVRTAILFLKLQQYRMIFDQLIKIGQRNSFLKAQNMMKWSFNRKKNIRKQFSYL